MKRTIPIFIVLAMFLISSCGQIQTESGSNDCYNSLTEELTRCYSDLAIKSNDFNVCDGITKSYQWTRDPALTAGYKIGNEFVIFGIIDYVIPCYTNYAVAKKDSSVSSVCDTKYGDSKYIAKECYRKFAQQTNDKNVCKNIPQKYVEQDSTFRNYCYAIFPDYLDMQQRGEI